MARSWARRRRRSRSFRQRSDCGPDRVHRGVALIGPIGAGKSTVAKLLAERLSMPVCVIDDLRSRYFPEIGYDHEQAEKLLATEGVRAMTEYWKPFEAHQIERVV